ncbi:MAG: aspartate/glutamate racemase family protein [bacterium]
MLDNRLELDVDLAREEHIRVARRLVAENPDVGAIVLECTNMPPYARDIQAATGLPVFDIVTLVNMVYHSVVKPCYSGIM